MSVRCPTCNRELDLDEIRPADQGVACLIGNAASSMPQHWLTTFRPDGWHTRGVALKSTKLTES